MKLRVEVHAGAPQADDIGRAGRVDLVATSGQGVLTLIDPTTPANP